MGLQFSQTSWETGTLAPGWGPWRDGTSWNLCWAGGQSSARGARARDYWPLDHTRPARRTRTAEVYQREGDRVQRPRGRWLGRGGHWGRGGERCADLASGQRQEPRRGAWPARSEWPCGAAAGAWATGPPPSGAREAFPNSAPRGLARLLGGTTGKPRWGGRRPVIKELPSHRAGGTATQS